MSDQKKQTISTGASEQIAGALQPSPRNSAQKSSADQQEATAATEMTSQSPHQASMEEADAQFQQRLCSIVIIDLNCKEIHLKTVMYELVFELREFLAEHVYTCFFTNFYFEHAGQRLNEYSELSELDLISNPRIIMKPEKYDEKSARNHVKRLVDILEKPPILTLLTQAGLPEESMASAPRSRSASHASQNNAQDGSEVPDQNNAAEEEKAGAASSAAQASATLQPPQEPMSEQEQKVKKIYEEFIEVIESHKNDDVITLTKKEARTTGQKILSNVTDLLQGSIYKSDLNKLNHIQCIESIEFSGFNPVSEERKMAGDIFYLSVRTLENPSQEHCITCSVNGFFKNDSTERVQFSPLPSQRANPCFSYTLAGCLNQLSNSFTRNLQSYLSSILKCEPYFISAITQPVTHWIVPSEKKIKVSNFEGIGQTINPMFGFDPKFNHEWNEEFQGLQAFPSESYLQRIQKDRAIIKLYQEFVEASIKGATAIIDGKVTSLNPNEPVRQHVYVYNHIFFSFAVDTPLSYKDLTSSDQFPSFTQANHDIKGLEQIKACDVPELHYLMTCLVDLKGCRMICQSIIPGILHNNDLSSLAEYGTIDDKKSIVASEGFHEKMLKVAQSLSLKVNKVIDQTNGNSVEIAGSTEVKGIKGTDKRSYVVDLQGLVPRDTNYMGDDFHTCLVRPELINLYQRSQSMEYASEHIKEFSQKLDSERQAAEPKPAEGEELNEEQKREVATRRQEDNLKKLREVERLIAEAPKHTFNSNVFKKNAHLDMTAEELAEEEKNVQNLATFINDKTIPNLIQDLKQQEGVPIDSQSLEDFFHKRGVNMRYLGKVLTVLTEQPQVQEDNMSIHMLQMLGEFRHLKILLEREILLRCAKHVVNRIIKEERGESDLHLSQVVAHCLNCILAPVPFIQSMNSGKVKPADLALQNSFQFFPEESIPSPRRNSMSADPAQSFEKVAQKVEQAPQVSSFEQKPAQSVNPENLTKKQLKKLKQKQNKQAAAQQQQEEKPQVKAKPAAPKQEMSEILFRQHDLTPTDGEEFKVADLFSQPVLSNGLHRLIPPTFISITPRQIYDEIKEIASVKFNYTLPNEQKKLGCLSTVHYKTALMRDLCKVLGIQLVADERKQYLLGNKIKPIVAYLNDAAQSEAAKEQNKRKKVATNQPALTEQDVLVDYKYMPFQASDIGKLYPNVKQIKFQNADVRAYLTQANLAQKENQLDRAFELWSQAINMLLQVMGAMTEEVADCITAIAGVQHKFGDSLQAIELQTKAIVLQERLLGVEHPHVGYSYVVLSLYYNNTGYISKGFKYLHRGLAILQASIGEYHPEIASIYLKMGAVYSEIDQMDAALEAYTQHSEQIKNMLGDEHVQLASSYQAIALCQYYRKDFRKALESQELSHNILKKLLPEGNPYVSHAKQQLDLYFKSCVQQEKHKSVISRPIGENKQKVDPRFLKAIADARRQKDLQAAQAQEGQWATEAQNFGLTPEQFEQRVQAHEASQRYQHLFKKLQNPKSKRDVLDLIEFQAMRDKQAQYSRILAENLAAQQQQQTAAAQKNEGEKEAGKEEGEETTPAATE